MNLQKKNYYSRRIILLFLLLLGNSNLFFSANEEFIITPDQKDQQELMVSPAVGEHIDDLFDSTLPSQKNLLFVDASLSNTRDYDAHIVNHTTTSLIYIKRSRSIFPSLGVKEVIFPFHIFL